MKLDIIVEFLDDVINDSGVHLLFKASCFLMVSLSFVSDFLLHNGLDANYFYFGMLGQFLVWLVEGRKYLKNKSNNLLVSWRSIALLLIDLIVGGTMAMITVSYIATQVGGFTPALLAIIIGALSYKVWDIILKRFDNNIGNSDGPKDTFADGGNNPTDPPR